MPRRNIHIDDETDAWLTEQAARIRGGRSAVVRELVREARKHGFAPGRVPAGVSDEQLRIITERVRQEILASLPAGVVATAGAEKQARPATDALPEDKAKQIQDKGAQSVQRWLK